MAGDGGRWREMAGGCEGLRPVVSLLTLALLTMALLTTGGGWCYRCTPRYRCTSRSVSSTCLLRACASAS